MTYLNWPLGQIALEIPGAATILFEHQINFCCDASTLLSEAIEQESHDWVAIQTSLEKLKNKQDSPIDRACYSDLNFVQSALSGLNDSHQDQLQELQTLSARVEKVHSKDPLCPKGLTQHLVNIAEKLYKHAQKEKSDLLPLINNGFNPKSTNVINTISNDHQELLAMVENIYQLTGNVKPHEKACNTWRKLYLNLQEFICDLNKHFIIENNILFNQTIT